MVNRDLEMITLTKTDGSQIVLNSELIKWLDGTADHTTTITLVTENRLMVRESVEEIIQSVVNYKRLTNIYELDPDIGNLDPSIKNI